MFIGGMCTPFPVMAFLNDIVLTTKKPSTNHVFTLMIIDGDDWGMAYYYCFTRIIPWLLKGFEDFP